ncbi:hypothetical protein B0H19DRAFT_1088930, partial [Mycena capillaripes]
MREDRERGQEFMRDQDGRLGCARREIANSSACMHSGSSACARRPGLDACARDLTGESDCALRGCQASVREDRGPRTDGHNGDGAEVQRPPTQRRRCRSESEEVQRR